MPVRSSVQLQWKSVPFKGMQMPRIDDNIYETTASKLENDWSTIMSTGIWLARSNVDVTLDAGKVRWACAVVSIRRLDIVGTNT